MSVDITRQLEEYWSSVANELPDPAGPLQWVEFGTVPKRPTPPLRKFVAVAAAIVLAIALVLAGRYALSGPDALPPADEPPLELPVDELPAVVLEGTHCSYFGPGTFPVGEPRSLTLVNLTDERIDFEVFHTSGAMTDDIASRIPPSNWPMNGFFYQATVSAGAQEVLDITPPEGEDVPSRWAIVCDNSSNPAAAFIDVVEP